MIYLAIDIGGTFIKYALVNDKIEILEKSKLKTPCEDDGGLDRLIEIISNIYNQYSERVEGIAISMPGILDSNKGYCYTGGSLPYISKNNIVEILENRLNIPVTIENDGKCAALAEKWCGSLKDVTNGAVVILGTGVGGGLIIDKKIYKGHNFSAGEFSYIIENNQLPQKYSSYWGSTGAYTELLKLVEEETGMDSKILDGYTVFEMANKGDKKVLRALEIYTKKLAMEIYNLQVLLDLDLIAIGGGISKQPILIEYLQKNIEDFCENNPIKELSPFIPKPKVTTCKFHNDSNLIGALYNFLTKKGMIINE